MTSSTSADQRCASGLLLLCLAITCAGLGRDVWRPDEPRVAAIAAEMSDTGQFVVPHLAGVPFVEKPPLYFVAAAGMIRLLGDQIGEVFAARLTSELCGLLALLFVYLMVRRLSPGTSAVIPVLILAATPVFIKTTQWIRVDVGLLTCVCAALWAMSETYLANRRWLLVVAGGCTGLAFLVKGLIGLAIIGMAWAALAVPWIWSRTHQRRGTDANAWIVAHLAALAAAASVIAAWVIPFRNEAGPELWTAWFWDNQFGRFTDGAKLGHSSSNPFYYVAEVFKYLFPWSPLVVVWFHRRIGEFRETRCVKRRDIFLLGWSIGTLCLLTLSNTKRGVYVLPAIPPFVIMCADVLGVPLVRGLRLYFTAVASLIMGILLLALTAPLMRGIMPGADDNGPVTGFLLFDYRPAHVATLLGLSLAVFLMTRARISVALRTSGLMAALYLGVLPVALVAADGVRSQREVVQSFLSTIPVHDRARVASYSLGESTPAFFYLYGRQIFDVVEQDRLPSILLGKDPDYDSVLIGTDPALVEAIDVPYSERAVVYLGRRLSEQASRSTVFWLQRPPGG